MEQSNDQNRRVVEYYTKTAEDYDKEYEVPVYEQLYDKVTWRYIEPYLPRKGLVLDAGGGTGKWAIPILEKGLKVVIYDISKEMLKVALRKAEERGLGNRVRVKQGDICDIDFQGYYFDFLLAEGDPISYCIDSEKTVGELYRLLKPGCYAAAGVDSLLSIVRRQVALRHDVDGAFRILREKRTRASDYPKCGFRWWAFTPKDLERLFSRHGFQVVKIVGKPIVYSRMAEQLLHDPLKTKKLLKLELALCEEKTIIGYGGHLHIVARKPV